MKYNSVNSRWECGDDTDTNTNIGNQNLTLSGSRSLNMSGNNLTFDGTGDVVIGDNGNVSLAGDLTVSVVIS